MWIQLRISIMTNWTHKDSRNHINWPNQLENLLARDKREWTYGRFPRCKRGWRGRRYGGPGSVLQRRWHQQCRICPFLQQHQDHHRTHRHLACRRHRIHPSPLLHRGRPGSSLLEPSIRSAWWKTTLPVFGEQTQDGWRRVEDGGGERMNKGWRRNCTAGRRRSGGSGARGGARWRWGLVEVRLHPKPAGWRDIAQSAEAFGSGWWRRS